MGSFGLPTTASPPVEYSKVHSTDVLQDGSFEIDQAPDSLPPKTRSSSCCFFGSMVACVFGTLALSSLLAFAVGAFERHPSSSPSPPADRSAEIFPDNDSAANRTAAPAPAPSSSISDVLFISSASLCNSTQDPAFCNETTARCLGSANGKAVSLPNLTAFVVEEALDALNRTRALAMDLTSRNTTGSAEMGVLQECGELLDAATETLEGTVEGLRHLDVKSRSKVRDVRVELSTAYSDEETCWDDFDGDAEDDGAAAKQMRNKGGRVTAALGLALGMARLIEDRMPRKVYVLAF